MTLLHQIIFLVSFPHDYCYFHLTTTVVTPVYELLLVSVLAIQLLICPVSETTTESLLTQIGVLSCLQCEN